MLRGKDRGKLAKCPAPSCAQNTVRPTQSIASTHVTSTSACEVVCRDMRRVHYENAVRTCVTTMTREEKVAAAAKDDDDDDDVDKEEELVMEED